MFSYQAIDDILTLISFNEALINEPTLSNLSQTKNSNSLRKISQANQYLKNAWQLK